MADLIDTHAHLDGETFAADLPDVLRRAAGAGVHAVVAVGITAASSLRCLDLAASLANVHPAVGIHPNEVADAEATDWDRVAALATHPPVVAIGETGLDRHWDRTPFPTQEEWFIRHLELARRQDLPIIIHCREAEGDLIPLLRDQYNRHGPLRGVMHSFAGTLATGLECLEMGLHLSFAGMLTYKSAEPLRRVAAVVPPHRLLVETDCPYLSPVPHRGKRNEPAHVVHTATCLAGLLGWTLDRLAEQTTRNARSLFRLPVP